MPQQHRFTRSVAGAFLIVLFSLEGKVDILACFNLFVLFCFARENVSCLLCCGSHSPSQFPTCYLERDEFDFQFHQVPDSEVAVLFFPSETA